MTFRVRRLPALLALLVLVLSLAESAWASTCAPGMEMDAAPTEVAMPGMEMDSPPPAPDTPAEDGREEPGCPLLPLLASGGYTAPHFAPPALFSLALFTGPAAVPFGAHREIHPLLLPSDLLDPPRA